MRKPEIQICVGAGCKAWGSKKLVRELERMQEWGNATTDYETHLVPCMKQCGGGVSVNSNEHKKKVLKFRTTEEALDQLGLYYQTL